MLIVTIGGSVRENTKEAMVSREVETRKLMLERISGASKELLSREVMK